MENPILSRPADDGTVTVAVVGEIDFSNSVEVSAGIRHAVSEWQPTAITIDLKDASFVDSTGLGALIEGFHAATESDCRFVVVNPGDNFRRVLSVTGLTELFGLTDDSDTGFAASEATGA